jgi:spore germination cell wall hydrolase CwlJ-like protein
MALCIYREARGEGILGKRGVAHVIENRTRTSGFGGSTLTAVILHPYAFSSFNPSDPNAGVWPGDTDDAWTDCLHVTSSIIGGSDEDLTNGALFYFSPPLLAPPHAWGPVEITLQVGRLTFCKPSERPVVSNLELAGES